MVKFKKLNMNRTVKKCIAEGKPLTENIVKDLYAILTENIIVGGIYRNQEVRNQSKKRQGLIIIIL